MKPDFRITFVITALLIVGALILPPWKNSFTGQFSGFHYLFSEADLVTMLELDYARLAIIIMGIILILGTVHALLQVIQSNVFFPQIFNLQKIRQLAINLIKVTIFLILYFLILVGLENVRN